jgi:hypothetical protein
MSSAHSEIQALCKECLQRLNSIRKGDEGAVDSAETTEAARTRLDAAMADLSEAVAVVIGFRPGPAVLQNTGFAAALARFSPQGAEEIQKVRLAASLLDRQLLEEWRAFRQGKRREVQIQHTNENDRALLRTLKVFLLERKIDASQDLIFQAAVRLALKLTDNWLQETFDELSQDRPLTKAFEEGEPSKIAVRFQRDDIPALHRLKWLLQQEAASVNDGIVLQTALRMVSTNDQLATEVMNVLDRGGGTRKASVLLGDSKDRNIFLHLTAQDQQAIMKLRDLLADQGLTGNTDGAIIRALVALVEPANDDFVRHARDLVEARPQIKRGVRDGEDGPSKTIDVCITSKQLSALKLSLLRAGLDANGVDIVRAAIRCVPSGAELASKLASQRPVPIQELGQRGQDHPSKATHPSRLRRGNR